jgi:hypothetical protein
MALPRRILFAAMFHVKHFSRVIFWPTRMFHVKHCITQAYFLGRYVSRETLLILGRLIAYYYVSRETTVLPNVFLSLIANTLSPSKLQRRRWKASFLKAVWGDKVGWRPHAC